MPDYNIYIRSVSTGGTSNPTQPWTSSTQNENVSWETREQDTEDGGMSFSQLTPMGLISKGISAASKSIPWVAAAIVVAKASETIVNTALDFKTITTGDYQQTFIRANMRNAIRSGLSPFSTAYQEIRQRVVDEIDRDRRIKTIGLLGDSTINSYFNRGV
jgi:hypothetical protein